MKCNFDFGKKGCLALVCYSNQECNARDKLGNPIYMALSKREKIKKKKKIGKF